MVATKFLQDDGEEDGVINEEWATSAGISTTHLNQLERDFLDAIVSISQTLVLINKTHFGD